jgi:sugar/nucleoside kinase (ribokinase family)
MSKFTVTGLGNAFTDCLLDVPQNLPQELGITLGAGDYARQPEEITQLKLQHGPVRYSSGGSVANTLDSMAKLGHSTLNLLANVGTDDAGQCFYQDAQAHGVTMPAPNPDTTSSEVICLLTPDGQRTFASVGATGLINGESVMQHQNWIKDADLVLIEGYLLFDQTGAVQAALETARAAGVKVGVMISSLAVIELVWQPLVQLLEGGVDLLFANADEHKALLEAAAGHQDNSKLLAALDNTLQIITRSGDGASAYQNGAEQAFVPTTAISQPVDTTGAGDAFCAGFLYQYLQQPTDLVSAMTLGHQLAAKVIMQVGGRLPKAAVQDAYKNFTAHQRAA